MKGKWWGVAGLVLITSVMLIVSSCGRSQELVSIDVQPAKETFGAANLPIPAGAQVQLRALGSYIHPPVTKDITSQVIWTSNTPQMVTVDASGLITVTGGACGDTLISATVNTNKSSGGISASGALVTGTMTASVVCPSGNGGGSGNPALTLTFQGRGAGSVSGNPAGFNCNSPGPCTTQVYPSGTTITLTASPTGVSTTGTWPVCPNANGNICTLDLTNSSNVTVAFN